MVEDPIIMDSEPVITKPRRGRKPKVKTEDDIKVKKTQTRSRKDKMITNTYDGTNSSNAIINNSDDEHVIVKLNIPNSEPNSPRAYTKNNEFSTIRDDCVNSCCDNVVEKPVEESGNKVIDLLRDFEEKNKNNEWPQTTSISCYWCCHKFQTTPFGLPVKYVNDKFHVVGCFCSLECALAYNYDMNDTVDAIWERSNLVNYLAKRIGILKTVKPAPPKLSLTMFGGHLSIEEFRVFCDSSKLININWPPMMTLRQQIEEINESDVFDSKYIPIDNIRIDKFKDKLVLKRSKPINKTEKTLDYTMNLRFGQN